MTIVLAGAIPAIITALVTLVLASRFGLGPVSKEAREQGQVLVGTLKDRVSYLEQENKRLKEENKRLEARLSQVEQRLLDIALGKRLAVEDEREG